VHHAWDVRSPSRKPPCPPSPLPYGSLGGTRYASRAFDLCGIDVHQAQIPACLRRVDADGQVTQEVREFATTDDAVLTLSTWLTEEQCPVAALESTGVYWRPVYHVLEGTVEVLIGNAQEMRRRPGHKTDKADARLIAELLAHGLIRPRFVPPPSIGALRDLTRTRVTLIRSRAQAKNRVVKVLEDTHIKLTSVVTDLFGRSGRRMFAALLAGERAPKTMAALALGVLRRKQSQLELALTGLCTDHQAWLIQGALGLIDPLGRQLTDLDQHIGELTAPLAPQMEQLTSIPGVEATAARAILAEIGMEMRYCGSAARLASWAGVCPGNDESAGKRRSGRTCKGNRDLRRVLVQYAWAARKTPTFLEQTCRRLEGCLRGKKAAMAVAHKILVIGYHLLLQGTCYEEARYDRLQARQEERQQQRAVKALEQLGYRVSLERMA
jgi:transposase